MIRGDRRTPWREAGRKRQRQDLPDLDQVEVDQERQEWSPWPFGCNCRCQQRRTAIASITEDAPMSVKSMIGSCLT